MVNGQVTLFIEIKVKSIVFQKYMINIYERHIMTKFLNFYWNFDIIFILGVDKMIYRKVQCKHCKDILTDDINEYQTCSCGKISFDTSDTTDVKMYRIVGNDEDVEIII